MLPLSLRTALGKCRNSAKSCWWQASLRFRLCFMKIWWRHVRKKVSSPEWRALLHDRQEEILAEARPLNVVFEVTGISKWKADSLLWLMTCHPRFKPTVWHVPYTLGGATERYQMELEQCRAHFSPLGVHLVQYASLADFPKEEKPDVVFVNEPYDASAYAQAHNKDLLDYLVCYIPYGMVATNDPLNTDQIINNAALFNFYENSQSVAQARRLMANQGSNAVLVGHPMADPFLYPWKEAPQVWKKCGDGLKRVIWAPHWTIEKETCWLRFGTFMQTGEIMLEMAEKYRGEIQFAFKPHPNLYYTLCAHPEWGKERTDAFYAKWREMPNTQFEDGAYTTLFMQSDAMIHDCGSFIQEYLFADKPCMYLKDPENRQEYSAMAADCLNAYQIGVTREEIEGFLQMVLRGEDPKAGVRRELRKKYLLPPNGQSAAQNIIDCLLMQDHHG